MYLHRIKVIDVLDNDFSEQILFVHDGRVGPVYKFGLHGGRWALRLHESGPSGPGRRVQRGRFDVLCP